MPIFDLHQPLMCSHTPTIVCKLPNSSPPRPPLLYTLLTKLSQVQRIQQLKELRSSCKQAAKPSEAKCF